MHWNEFYPLSEEAFSDIERPATSLRQFLLTDKFGMSGNITDRAWDEAGRNRVDCKWTDIPDSEIEECDCLLAHLEHLGRWRLVELLLVPLQQQLPWEI